MRYYAKIKQNEEAIDVYRRFDGVTSYSNVVLDAWIIKKPSGTYTKLKDELERHPEDLMIDSLYSLGKNAREIAKELKWFKEHHIEVYVLALPSTMEPDISRVAIMYDVNQMYADREIQHIKDGQESVRNTKHIGRPSTPYPDNWAALYQQWAQGQITSAEFEEMSELSHGTFYNMLRRYKEELQQNNSGQEEA